MLDPAARPTILNEKIPQIPPIPSVNKMFQKLRVKGKSITTQHPSEYLITEEKGS